MPQTFPHILDGPALIKKLAGSVSYRGTKQNIESLVKAMEMRKRDGLPIGDEVLNEIYDVKRQIEHGEY